MDQLERKSRIRLESLKSALTTLIAMDIYTIIMGGFGDSGGGWSLVGTVRLAAESLVFGVIFWLVFPRLIMLWIRIRNQKDE